MNTAIIKPLGKITAILADLGLEVTYAFDDLVFVQHSAFLLQFLDDSPEIKLFINTECKPDVAEGVEKQIVEAHAKAGFSIVPAGRFTIKENDNETLDISFS